MRRDDIVQLVKEKSKPVPELIADFLMEASGLDTILFETKIGHIIGVFNKVDSSKIDEDLEDLLDLNTYTFDMTLFLGQDMLGERYVFKLGLKNSIRSLERLSSILDVLDNIKIKKITDSNIRDSKGNIWIVESLGLSKTPLTGILTSDIPDL